MAAANGMNGMRPIPGKFRDGLVSGIAWAEILASDPGPWVHYLRALGFSEDPHASDSDHGTCLESGLARVYVTVPGRDDSEQGQWLARHGEGVWDVALHVPDTGRVLEASRQAGIQVTTPERRHVTGRGLTGTPAAVVPQSGLRHTLVEGRPSGNRDASRALDHVAVAIPAAATDEVVRLYGALGLSWTPTERVTVGEEGLESGVLEGPGCTIVLVSQDPARQPGQVDQFLRVHDGPGVQHMAFLVPDIVTAVRSATAGGAKFLHVPGAYYDALPGRVPGAGTRLDDLRDLGILADEDTGRAGELYQIFTRRPAPPSEMFFELVERQGSLGFGLSNIAHLYAARQAEAALSARAGD
jgi:4-hydroxymandelate synthase